MTYDREQAIQSLIDNDDMSNVSPSQLRAAYDLFSDEEIMEECEVRDISYVFGPMDDEREEIERLKDEKNGVYPDKWDIAN